jgi:tight adherence protein B
MLRDCARKPGAEALTAVAAAWEVSERTGAALSSVLVAVADSLRAQASTRREAEAQLASVRSTARLMAVLPVGTLAVFSAGDTSAIAFLTNTAYGWACVGMAAVFIAAGVLWVDRTARNANVRWT